ncbi:hypothetical protein [Butyrivibrio sp. NC3005]|uniref:hypothetical protein n=1 Tax=Butyrivibrio sp. NC3005 TaxID=1280685 RepID=UPI00042A7832|nr:hypothetical protein [Butyrivibrio sp. NC3005]
MDKLWLEFDRRIDNALKLSNGKRIVLWGYGSSGKFLTHYFRRKNRIIDVIIDNKADIPTQMHVYQSFILDELSEFDYFVICDFEEELEVSQMLENHGFKRNFSYIWIREWLGTTYCKKISYYDWLDFYYGTDICEPVYNSKNDNLFYSYGCDYALLDVIDNLYLDGENFFDFGFGKGGALILFASNGVNRIGGVEYDSELYEIGISNLKKCNINHYELFNDDASKLTTELDTYTIFNMYNPFKGEVFQRVIMNIEESYERMPRRILLLYSGVTQHKDIIRNDRFRLARKINNEYWNKYTNIIRNG